MAFSSDLATLVADQINRFVTLKPHQLAGQVANLDFWLGQVSNALDVIDGYGVRFVRMEGAQKCHVDVYGVLTSQGEDSEISFKASPPHRVPDNEMRKARKLLVEATNRLLTRCRNADLITDIEMTSAYARLGIEACV